MKFKWFFSCVIFILYTLTSEGQTIQIINKQTQKPIENVCIHTEDYKKVSTSDENGNATLKGFVKSDTIFFTHPFFKMYRISYADLEYMHFKVAMIEDRYLLPIVDIVDHKWTQLKKEVPNKITTITQDDIEFNNPLTSADLLSQSGQVFVQKSQLGGGSPMLRGFATNSVLLVVDGIRMNNAIYRSGNIQNVIGIDPNVVEQTDVIFGPGSILYGSDALGGVMNFKLKDPQLSPADTLYLKANAFTRYSTASNERSAHFDVNLGFKKWALFTSGSFSSFGDLKTGSIRKPEYADWGKRPEYVTFIKDHDTILKNPDENIQINSGYDQVNFLTKVLIKPNENFNLLYIFHYTTTSNVPRYDRLIEYSKGQLKYGEWYYGPQEWMLNALNLNFTKKTKLYDHAKIIISYQDYEESRNDRKFGNYNLRKRTEHVNILNTNIDLEKKFNNYNTLYYGVEGLSNFVESTGLTENILTGETGVASTRYPDGGSKYMSTAVYGNFKTGINERYKKKLTLILGARYSFFYIKSLFIDKTFYDFPFDEITMTPNAFNGGVGLVYRPNENIQLNYNLTSGFRAPNIDDIGKIFDSEPGSVVVPNEKLKSENAFNADFGFITELLDKKLKAEIDLYYTLLTDAMVRRDFKFNGQDSIMYDGEMSKVQAIVNSGEANIFGGSIGIYYAITNHFAFTTDLTYTYGRDMTDDLPLQHVPPTFGSTRVSFKNDKFRFDIYANYSGNKPFEEMAPSEQEKFIYAPDGSSPSWYTLNFRSSYQILPLVHFDFGIENIMDVHYRPYASGISAPGRNFVFALKASI